LVTSSKIRRETPDCIEKDKNIPGQFTLTPQYVYIVDSSRGSIRDGVMGVFLWLTPSGRTMAVGSTSL